MVLGLEKVLHIEDSKLMAGETTDFYGSGLSKQDRFAKTGSGQAFGRLLFKKDRCFLWHRPRGYDPGGLFHRAGVLPRLRPPAHGTRGAIAKNMTQATVFLLF